MVMRNKAGIKEGTTDRPPVALLMPAPQVAPRLLLAHAGLAKRAGCSRTPAMRCVLPASLPAAGTLRVKPRVLLSASPLRGAAHQRCRPVGPPLLLSGLRAHGWRGFRVSGQL